MDLKKQAIILALIVALVGIGQLAYQKLFNQQSSPATSAVYFATHHLEINQAVGYVSKSDQAVVQQLQKDYVGLTKLPNQAINKAEIAADITLSEVAHKVDLNTEHGLISLNMLKEDDKWVAVLNLRHNFEVKQLLESLKIAEAEENEFTMLTIYRKLNELNPTPEYKERIDRLTSYIELKEAKAGYVKNIAVTDLALKGRVLTGMVKNVGNRSVSTIKVNLQLVNTDGSIREEIPVTLYEVIPGSMVFGQPIMGGYEKRFGLDIQGLKQITSVENLTISVTEVEFAP
jgi:hypothetical protein